MYPDLQYLVVCEVVEEHLASSGSVWKLEERLVVVRHWDLQARKVWIDRILQSDPAASPGTGPCKSVVALIKNVLKQVIKKIRWLNVLHQYGLAPLKPQGSKEEATTWYHVGDHIHIENLPWSKTLHHARLRCESKRSQSVEPIETGNRGKGRLDPTGGGKAARRKGGRHTLAVLA